MRPPTQPTLERMAQAALLITALPCVALGDPAAPPPPAAPAQAAVPVGPSGGVVAEPIPSVHSQRVREMIALLRLQPLFDRFNQASARWPEGAIEAETARQEITDKLLHASLQIDRVISLIQREQSEIQDLRAFALSKRDLEIRLIGFSSGTLAAISTVGAGLTLVNNPDVIRAGVSLGVTALGIAAITTIASTIFPTYDKAPIGLESHMLGPIFASHPGPEVRELYPSPVWEYLDTPVSGQPPPRVQLVNRWLTEKRIPSPDTPEGRKKIDVLTRPIPKHRVVNLPGLQVRIAMLSDLRLMVSSLKDPIATLFDSFPERAQPAHPSPP